MYAHYHHIDWLGLIPTIIAFAALGLSAYQAWLLRSSNNAELILKFDDQFNSDGFLEIRKRASKNLKAKPIKDTDDIEDVLDFFETLGIMVRKSGLDPELVWHTFFYWVHGYWIHTKDLIEQQRKDYPNRYKDIIFLHSKILEIEKTNGRINEEEWNKFLEEEENL